MVTDTFFSKTKYIASKLTDQTIYTPAVLFTLPVYVIDSLAHRIPTSITAKLIKTVGRTKTILPTVITVTNPAVHSYSFAGTPALLDWDGTTNLSLELTITDTAEVSTLVVPLVVIN